VTQVLVAILVVTSVAASLAHRLIGFDPHILAFDAAAVVHQLQLWRLATYALCKAADPFALLLSALVLYLFGSTYERSWGSRDFLRFFCLSSVGAAVLCIPLSALCNLVLPFWDVAQAEGPDAAIDAMLVATAVYAPQANMLFGFVLPVRARTLVALLLGTQLVAGLMTGAASFSMTLGGMAMGWLLVSGSWRPRLWLDHWRLWRLRRRRRGLHVVRPRGRRHLN
jgi:membrane associated rhomboid family serine protease